MQLFAVVLMHRKSGELDQLETFATDALGALFACLPPTERDSIQRLSAPDQTVHTWHTANHIAQTVAMTMPPRDRYEPDPNPDPAEHYLRRVHG